MSSQLMLTTNYLEPSGLQVVKKSIKQETEQEDMVQKSPHLLNKIASKLPTSVPGGLMANLSMLKMIAISTASTTE
ncbi:hypothetical protein KBI23_24310 [bacterium]|nr:hypothetical protein [bacterium]